ncbi:MAG: hypothetical protein C0404_11480 [Verrucomicrobia bacterium]|nr:hypothetical protein [Verrucomicrobiota bacterium]
MLGALIEGVLDIAYPRQCIGCGKAVVTRELSHFCWDCVADLDKIVERFCRLCGDPVDGMVEHEFTCSVCTDSKPHFDLARSAARHRGSIRKALHSFKYGQMTCLTDDFSQLMVACVNTHYAGFDFDAVTCVPLYPKKERERSYNQARLLARGIAGMAGIRFVPNCLARIRDTPSQTDRTARQRQQNVRGAFTALNERWIEGRKILLVDDVMTTGATVNECARVLKKAGAFKVCVVTLARG